MCPLSWNADPFSTQNWFQIHARLSPNLTPNPSNNMHLGHMPQEESDKREEIRERWLRRVQGRKGRAVAARGREAAAAARQARRASEAVAAAERALAAAEAAAADAQRNLER